jgi:hypothetical protein
MIAWRRGHRDQVEPNPVERVERHGPDTAVLDWREQFEQFSQALLPS